MGKRDNRRTRKMKQRRGQVKKKARLARKMKGSTGTVATKKAAPKAASTATVKRAAAKKTKE